MLGKFPIPVDGWPMRSTIPAVAAVTEAAAAEAYRRKVAAEEGRVAFVFG